MSLIKDSKVEKDILTLKMNVKKEDQDEGPIVVLQYLSNFVWVKNTNFYTYVSVVYSFLKSRILIER